MSPGTERFRHVYADNFEPLLAYAMRRVDQPEDAADVVAETFLIAWRRHPEIPGGDEARLWLYGVARRVLSNQNRGGRRRERLGARLRERLATGVVTDPAAEVSQQVAVRAALARLGELDREVLRLTAWEGLEPREVAEVLNLSAATVRTRLSRARSRLRDLLGHDFSKAGHVLALPAPEERR
ncbi:RNA polymerase sigma factor [Actinoplanes solisilvae]|uniref:RNA polymerase sigma factor n=1 Tax=Actinoplanes solisilvae TaxID=2486853 RepID=UPI000FDADE51|nr:sigma-70 family RNA polymerase sigma factor [Actinoplanes solisilvae]